MWNLLFQIATSTAGFFLTTKIVSGVTLPSDWQTFFIAGTILGTLNFFLKPALKILSLPLRIVTFGAFGLVINIGLIWLVDILMPQLKIDGLAPLFWASIVIWSVNFFLKKLIPQGIKK